MPLTATTDPTIEGSWGAGLDARRRADALSAARLIALRVTDPETVSRSLALAQQQTSFPRSVHWSPASVAQGDAGQALLCAQMDHVFPGEGWEARGLEHLSRATDHARAQQIRSAGAASGLSGLAFATAMSAGDDRFRGPRADMDRSIAQASFATIAELHARSGVAPSTFDVISGLSGTALYLLPLDRPAGVALPFVLQAIANLALAEGALPAWHTPVDLLYDDDQMRQYPYGNLNVGLAHGVPGMLAALSLAVSADLGNDNVQRAVERLADWLMRNGRTGEDAPSWPLVIPIEAYGSPEVASDPRVAVGRDAWCYGTPGVARALFLAGVALDRPAWRSRAIEAMTGVYGRPVEQRAIDSPTFCHGVSGLLQITLRFGYDTGLPVFEQAAADLLDQVLAAVDQDRPLGVANVEPGNVLVDQPGLLDGATGVSLTLLSAAGRTPPSWDRLFALS